jgi:Leucine-rich repeat (LRR) protein
VYDLRLSSRSLADLEPLRGMPLGTLHISHNPQLRDLAALADCPLKILDADNLTNLTDLSPLKDKDLQELSIARTSVASLGVLAGMRNLSKLVISGTRVADLAPISDARLKSFSAENCKIRGLEPLRGQPLEQVFLSGTRIDSLEPLGEAPLEVLAIEACGRLDLASLKSRKFRRLYAAETTLDHLELLAEMTELEVITLPKNLTDPSLLRKLSHLQKIDTASYSSVSGRWENLKDAEVFWHDLDAKARREGSE